LTGKNFRQPTAETRRVWLWEKIQAGGGSRRRHMVTGCRSWSRNTAASRLFFRRTATQHEVGNGGASSLVSWELAWSELVAGRDGGGRYLWANREREGGEHQGPLVKKRRK
ncbi:hypothetical protein TorRG33x02_174050, partial [Trema orientale]